MAKLPFMQFFTRDWLGDPAVSACSPATRGVLFDLLCAMHEAGRSGELCNTTDAFARIARCSTADFAHAMTELKTTGAADVHDRNGNVTITNRRMKRESDERKAAAIRQHNHRSANVTPVSRESHGDVTPPLQRSEVIQDPPTPPPAGGRVSRGRRRTAEQRFADTVAAMENEDVRRNE